MLVILFRSLNVFCARRRASAYACVLGLADACSFGVAVFVDGERPPGEPRLDVDAEVKGLRESATLADRGRSAVLLPTALGFQPSATAGAESRGPGQGRSALRGGLSPAGFF